MNSRNFVARSTAATLMLALAACGGGGGSSADTSPSAPPVAIVAAGPDSFLLFPNPLVQTDGSLQTTSLAYAEAYYRAIDPVNAKDTFAKWKAANSFDSGMGTQVTAVFGDKRDLGYGRRMTARQNLDGTIAFFVENYLTNPGGAYAYSPLSLDAAIVQDARWRLFINAIEFSPGPAGGVGFAKFFTFNASTGQRETMVDLDGRGPKAMPGPCVTCHGGRGDPLTPPDATGKPLFNLVLNSASQTRGDVQAHLHIFEVDTFDFSTAAGFTRADQEANLKMMNKLVLCTYPLPTSSDFPEDSCRRLADHTSKDPSSLIENSSEWQGTAADLLKAAYGGDRLPNARFSDTFIPADWLTKGQSTLYREVVAPSCRACHLLRGTYFQSFPQSDIDFHTFTKFQSYSDRIKAHVIDRGNMPLAKIVFDDFWGSNKPETLAVFLEGQGFPVRNATGAVLQPGRPVADPGPDRVIPQGPTTLSAASSLFAQIYTWSIISGPNGNLPPSGATLTNPTSTQPTFNSTIDGTYVLQLVAANGLNQSPPVQLTLVVNNALFDAQFPAPTAIRFSDIKNVMQKTPDSCVTCHSPTGILPRPPIFYGAASSIDIDRNGDGIVDATDDLWFYAEVRGRINFTDIVASPLLRKPSGNHHGALPSLRPNFDTTKKPGDSLRKNYDLFLNWILNGAPY